ncbi:hypothetical protein MKX01_029436 [Papaver californicum]|nr:hypothetical protein MKX01_029436 [Papaver californicum]
MAASSSHQIFRSISLSSPSHCLRTFTSSSSSSSSLITTKPFSSPHHQHVQEYSEQCNFLGSWKAPKNPKEAEAKIGLLRRDYAKQVRELRIERAQNLESWRLKEQVREEKKLEKAKELHKQSSVWIEETDMEKKILEAIVDRNPL